MSGLRGYSFRWNHRRNKPGEELTDEQARQRDAAGTEYTAVLPPRPGTRSPVLVTPVWQTGVVVVSFLDDPGRKVVEYVFTKKDDSRMFLSGVHLWEYADDQPGRRLSEAVRREDIRYHENGYVHRTIVDKTEGYKETVEYNDVPVETNWEPVPAFGDYTSIGRFERGRSALTGTPPAPRPGV